ncbi:hypothetical protein QP940_01990 [Corynebacterium pseudodiphtheriticum]|uniref:hypothetical protein n=1 Tax=Corynebacterium pseudodiphtheriticum TaxID=37637 RepID=UPI00254CE847|nr:hypothetical protein [Corynebacterium pseudodiphtheriticum]MDK8499816.1 hypothetical protein [Corynebacterium pseudodiphtheriticum]MDK8551618.1 hypothetical protein [Corynebacterium pseudodiphtheriticum]MDK8562313.1 hypothetical protein [Corynebacterium pseudodiphtheriticum]MDK8613535.1 hypothetical protein [Corynebacterium pseudodiphtheriticum]MDK8737470.1 hypothetical protein [Corynebacterium pseudodiphtheriticum]
MINQRVFAAAVVSLSLAVPVAASVTAEAQAQPVASVQNQAFDATKQVIVNPVKVGDTKLTGKVLLEAGRKAQYVSILFNDRAHQQTVLASRQEAFGSDLVSFEYAIPTLYQLRVGETITVGIAGKPETFQQIQVGEADVPVPDGAPEKMPEHKPGIEDGRKPAPGQSPEDVKPDEAPKPPQSPGLGNGGLLSSSSSLFG